MIVVLDENGVLQLTDKAMMISAFRVFYDSFEDSDLAMSYFSFMYYMYAFDSAYLRNIEDESKRIGEVKKFVHRGSELKVSREVRKVMNVYKEIFIEESVSMYLVMRTNVEKLKKYANKMCLFDPNAGAEEGDSTILVPGLDYVLVDSKEFTTVNSMLPKQQEELDKFEVHLLQTVKNKIDIYGGGSLGAYEDS
jgi:hypothetical protein